MSDDPPRVSAAVRTFLDEPPGHAKGICFEISYLVRFLEGRPVILAYVSHEDQEEVMRTLGLI